ncbi:hypothetical protein E0W60_34675 (plasmid) [Cupriavidus oxalaticus]|uniref:Uncharacterized protein n=1 Tax=Cupriavidus oxalaticus TaxID=96344 RepID=A0A4V1BZR1_9BURK|nr:hypothetical protein E0W60_34675 [Cupriavidus oxalaticus]
MMTNNERASKFDIHFQPDEDWLALARPNRLSILISSSLIRIIISNRLLKYRQRMSAQRLAEALI